MRKGNDAVDSVAWHAFDTAMLQERLVAGPGGLDQDEATRRLVEFGPNRFPERPPPSPAALFLTQFRSPLIYVLLIAAGISIALGDATDAVFILIVVLVNATIGTFLEGKAEQSARALRTQPTVSATVLRSRCSPSHSSGAILSRPHRCGPPCRGHGRPGT